METASQYPSDFRPYTPSNYRVERSSPIKLCGLGPQSHGADSTRSRLSGSEDAGAGGEDAGAGAGAGTSDAGVLPHGVKCSYPLDVGQLQGVDVPASDWNVLIQSLWAPWCGYKYQNTLALVEADGFNNTVAKVLDSNAGILYMRGYPKPSGGGGGSSSSDGVDDGYKSSRAAPVV